MYTSSQIYVFRTDVRSRRLANQLCKHLEKQGVAQRATLDLDDCDRVLRVESSTAAICYIQKVALALGVNIQELD